MSTESSLSKYRELRKIRKEYIEMQAALIAPNASRRDSASAPVVTVGNATYGLSREAQRYFNDIFVNRVDNILNAALVNLDADIATAKENAKLEYQALFNEPMP